MSEEEKAAKLSLKILDERMKRLEEQRPNKSVDPAIGRLFFTENKTKSIEHKQQVINDAAALFAHAVKANIPASESSRQLINDINKLAAYAERLTEIR